MNDPKTLWSRYQKYLAVCPSIDLCLDISRMSFDDGYFDRMKDRMQSAFAEMAELEKGAIANPDEKRMVGHYWLRNSALAPTAEIRAEIDKTLQRVKTFAAAVHAGEVRG